MQRLLRTCATTLLLIACGSERDGVSGGTPNAGVGGMQAVAGGMGGMQPGDPGGQAGTAAAPVAGTTGGGVGGSGGVGGMGGVGGSGGVGGMGGSMPPDCDYPGAAGEFYDEQIDINGETRSYYILVPDGYDPCTPMPMLIFFHGTDKQTDPIDNQQHYVNYTRLPESAAENDYILVIPSGIAADDTYVGRALIWFGSSDNITGRNDDLVLALMQALPARYHVDTEQVFFAGFSSGAHFAVYLLAHHGEMFAGAGVFAGSITGQKLSEAPLIPVFLRVGVDDASYLENMRALRDALIENGWVDGDTLDYAEIDGLPHEYPTTWLPGKSENQPMWDFFTRPR